VEEGEGRVEGPFYGPLIRHVHAGSIDSKLVWLVAGRCLDMC